MYQRCRCGQKNYKIYNYNNKEEKFSVIKCRECGLAGTWPAPSSALNPKEYYCDQKDYIDRFENIDLWEKFAQRTALLLKKYKASGKLLDVGCNIGIFVKIALKNGYISNGIDIAKRAVDFGNNKLDLGRRLEPWTLTERKFRAESYEIIVYIHTLEHIKNLDKELKEVFCVLKKGGILLIEAPNFNSIWRRVLKSRWYGFAHKEHYWQFSEPSLNKTLIENGFKIIKSYTNLCLDHDYSFSPKGIIKVGLYVVSKIFSCGDNLIIISQKDKNAKKN